MIGGPGIGPPTVYQELTNIILTDFILDQPLTSEPTTPATQNSSALGNEQGSSSQQKVRFFFFHVLKNFS